MTQTDGKIQYFLGANSAQGFVSLYHELIDESTATAYYILKGGPGCGKSTLMKKIGEELEQQGVIVEYILCSGDPNSLDAIYMPEKAVAIVDGTAPHAWRTETQKDRSQQETVGVQKFTIHFLVSRVLKCYNIKKNQKNSFSFN